MWFSLWKIWDWITKLPCIKMVCYSSHYLNTRLFYTIFRYLWPEYQTNIKFPSHKLQSEYGNHLNTNIIWYQVCANSSKILHDTRKFVTSSQMVRHSNGSLKNVLKKACPKCLVFEWSTKSWDLTIWIQDTHSVRYSGVLYLDHLNLTQITLILIRSFR